jgi:hypothetical protein
MLAGPILIALLLCAGKVSANDSSDPLLDHFARISVFAFGPVGYAGVISQGERDFRRIRSRPSARGDFENLLAVGNRQAKAYALVGLRELDPKSFKKLASSLGRSTEDVVGETGCIGSHQPLRSVIKRITADEFQIYASIPQTTPEP